MPPCRCPKGSRPLRGSTLDRTVIDAEEFEAEELEVASAYHDGGGSMLYALASTGALSLGSIRPRDDDGPVSDQEWARSLAANLAWEAEDAARIAAQNARRGSRAERAEARAERQALLSIADKANAAVRRFGG